MKNALTLNGAAVQNCWTMYNKYDPAHSYFSLIKIMILLDLTAQANSRASRRGNTSCASIMQFAWVYRGCRLLVNSSIKIIVY
jgi:hypothetical protein